MRQPAARARVRGFAMTSPEYRYRSPVDSDRSQHFTPTTRAALFKRPEFFTSSSTDLGPSGSRELKNAWETTAMPPRCFG
jgi:hypothetical protein